MEPFAPPLVLDDDREAVLLPQLLGNQPGEYVHAAAGGERHDELNGAIAQMARLCDGAYRHT